MQDLPFFYPANVMMYLNGSTFPKNTTSVSGDLVYAVHSLISENEYDAELKKPHFGRMTQVEFLGYNNNASFPFWSSDSFTYASAMLALSQYRALEASGQLPHKP